MNYALNKKCALITRELINHTLRTRALLIKRDVINENEAYALNKPRLKTSLTHALI